MRLLLPPFAPGTTPALAVLGVGVAWLASTALSILPLLEFHLNRVLLENERLTLLLLMGLGLFLGLPPLFESRRMYLRF